MRIQRLNELFGIDAPDYIDDYEDCCEDAEFVLSPAQTDFVLYPRCVRLTPEELRERGRKISQTKMGHRHSEETKQKIRESVSNLQSTQAQLEWQQRDNSGANNPFFGSTHTDESKALMRNAKQEKVNNNYNLYLDATALLDCGMSRKQAAEALGVNIHTMDATLTRWRKRLKGHDPDLSVPVQGVSNYTCPNA